MEPTVSQHLMNMMVKILMSFNGNFNNVSTIAHESGHNVNHQYIVENNMPLYSTNNPLTGEVASLTK